MGVREKEKSEIIWTTRSMMLKITEIMNGRERNFKKRKNCIEFGVSVETWRFSRKLNDVVLKLWRQVGKYWLDRLHAICC